MDYMKDFLAALQEGTSVEDLAKSLTAALNDANRKYQEEQNGRRQKVDAVGAIIDAINDLTALYGLEPLEATLSEKEQLVDEIDELLQELSNLRGLLREAPIDCFKENFKGYKEKNNKDPIEEFLDKFVR